MRKRYVVVSGLPASGKTTVARQLATAIGVPLLDKDDILEELFDQRGVGDPAWRRMLSRESDTMLQERALRSDGAVVSSFWRLPGMPADSGTPTDWLRSPTHCLVNVHCACAPDLAARRYCNRRRHPGHLDQRVSYADVLEDLQRLASLPSLQIGTRIEIDTARALDLDEVLRRVRAALADSPV